ncbi:hypothetical protein RB595_001463 [Gaeumannomyces hyphopodioides]
MRLETLFPVAGNAGDEPPIVDVVLVHGLDSPLKDPTDRHRTKTWTAEDGTVWPLDLLPKRLPRARVLCYEYNASIRGTTQQARVKDHADGLLQQFMTKRDCSSGSAKQRPIIFVGHSLGGVIIKQAMVSAHTNPKFKYLGRATCGIIFFATPHHLGGSEGGKQFATRLLRAVVAQYGKPSSVGTVKDMLGPARPTAKMLEDIENNSNSLTHLTDGFHKALNYFKAPIYNFYEQEITKVLGEVVLSEGDTYLGGADSQPLSGDHLGICKFRADETGKTRSKPVFSALEKLTKVAIGTDESRLDDLLKSLCTDEFHDESDEPSPTKDTGRWIESTAEFQEWQDGATKKLWIHGDTAVGKTYLARNIINRLRDMEEVHVVRCFLDGRLKERNTSHAIFRSTIHQLAAIYPDIWSKTRAWEKLSISPNIKVDLSKARREDGTAMRWEVEDLMILWKDMVAEAAVNGDKGLAIVVDGFDEIPEGDQTEFLDCLQGCEREKTGGYGRPDLRVLVLSRWCASLDDKARGFAAYEIKKSDNEQDIRQTVEKALRGFARQANYSEPFQNELCGAVVKGAQGTYLWATLMMADIRINRPKQHQLEQQLKELPRSLAKLFDEIIGRIESRGDSSWNTTRDVLLWVVFGLEPLGLQELNAALALTKVCQNPPKEPIDAELIGEWMSDPDMFKARLAMACGQLLSISTMNHVTTVHRTLADYLNTTPGRFEEWGWEMPNHKRFYRSPKDAHAKLGHICAAYLRMPSFEDAGQRFKKTDNGAEWEIKVGGRITNHQLVSYAALCWSRHFQAARAAGGDDGSSSHMDIRDPTKGLCVSWSEVWWYFRKWRALPFPETLEDLELLLREAKTAGNSLLPPTEDQHGRELVQPTRQSADMPTGQSTGQSVGHSAGQSTGQSTGQSITECTKKEPFTLVVEEPASEKEQPPVEYSSEGCQPGLKDQLPSGKKPAEGELAEKCQPALGDQTVSENKPAAKNKKQQPAPGQQPLEDLPPVNSLLPAAEEKEQQLPMGHQRLEEDQPYPGKQTAKQEQTKESQQPEGSRSASEDRPLSESQASSYSQPTTKEQPHDNNSQHSIINRPRSKSKSSVGGRVPRQNRAKAPFTPLPTVVDGIKTLNTGADNGGDPANPVPDARHPGSAPPAQQDSGGPRGQTPPSPSRESVGDATSTSDAGLSSSDTGLSSSYIGSEGSSSYLLPPIRRHSPLKTSHGPRSPERTLCERPLSGRTSHQSRSPPRTSHEQGSSRNTSHGQHPPQSTSYEQHPPQSTSHEQHPPQSTLHEQYLPQSTSNEQHPPQSTSHEQYLPQSTSHEQRPPQGASHEQRPPQMTFIEWLCYLLRCGCCRSCCCCSCCCCY